MTRVSFLATLLPRLCAGLLIPHRSSTTGLLVSLSPLLLVSPFTALLLYCSAALSISPSPAQADIFQWEYINPADPSQGKRQSTTLAPDGAGVDAVPGANLRVRNLTMAYLIYANLTNADLSQANLTNASLSSATLTDADFTDAEVRGASLSKITLAQLYSTASYQAHDLSGIGLGYNDLSGANFARQTLTNADFGGTNLTGASFRAANLTNANFAAPALCDFGCDDGIDYYYATLTNADFTDAVVRGANPAGMTLAQLYSTASYQAHDLSGIGLENSNLIGGNFAAQNLTNADFFRAGLTDADFEGADIKGASFGVYLPYYSRRGAVGTGITLSQLYSTESYQAHDLSGVHFDGNVLSGGNFAGQNLTHAVFAGATLTDANFTGAQVKGANFVRFADYYGNIFGGITLAQLYSTASYQAKDLSGINFAGGNDLAGANFSGQNLTNAKFFAATLTSADFTGAEVRGASFDGYYDYNTSMYVGGLTLAQLYSTASYQAHDLSGIGLGGVILQAANFQGQNLADVNFEGAALTGANFHDANLTNAYFMGSGLFGADFTGAVIQGATFGSNGAYAGGSGITPDQLYSTASYQSHDLAGIRLYFIDVRGWNFAGQKLTNAVFYGSYRTGTDFTGADARHAGLSTVDAVTTNLIRPDGHIIGLDLVAGGLLVVRDYDGVPDNPALLIPITIDQHLAMGPGGMLRMVFEADAWDSTISFAPGIPVTLGGTLELNFAADVNPASQVGRTFDLFDWTGVSPTGTFAVSSPYRWDLSHLYTTGQVTLTAMPEPSDSLCIGICLATLALTGRISLASHHTS